MANMFSGNDDRRIPRTLNECLEQDGTATNLHCWSERLEELGQIVLVLMIIAGIIFTIIEAATAAKLDEETVVPTVLLSLMKWGLYAFLEYCIFTVFSLLLGALAKITQNTIISAKVALYESRRNECVCQETVLNATYSKEAAPKQSVVQKNTEKKEIATDGSPVIAEICDGEKICPTCGTVQKLDRKVCWSCGTVFNN